MSIETETIDRLFLELSQFTTAKTARELELQAQVDRVWALINPANYENDTFTFHQIRQALQDKP